MALSDNVLTTFVDICAESLEAEDRQLHAAFQAYSPQRMYADRHHGIWNLLEGHKLHTVFRALLEKGFPVEVIWEGTRPGGGRGDFILRDEQAVVVGAIEAKDLMDLGCIGRLRPVLDDITKMNRAWPGPEVRKFCLLFWHASSEKEMQRAILEFEQPPLHFHDEWQRTFPTRRYLEVDRCQQDGIFCMTLLEVTNP